MRKVEQNCSTSAANIPTTTTNCETSSEHRTLDASGGAMPFVRLFPDISRHKYDGKNELGNDAALLLDLFVFIYNGNKQHGRKYNWFFCTESTMMELCNLSRDKAKRCVEKLVAAKFITFDYRLEKNRRRFEFGKSLHKYYVANNLDGQLYRNHTTANGQLSENHTTNTNNTLFDNVLTHQLLENPTTAPHNELNNNALHNQLSENSTTETKNAEKENQLLENPTTEMGQLSGNPTTQRKETNNKRNNHFVQNQVLDGERDFEFSDSPESGNASHHCETNADPNPTPNCAAPLPTSSLNVPSKWWDALRLTDDQRTRILWEWEHLDCNIRKPSSELFKFFYIVYSALYRRANYRSYEKIVEASKQITDETQFVQSFIQQHTDGTIKIQSMLDYIASTTHKPNASTKPKASGARKKSSNNYDDNKLFVDFWERYPRTRGTKKADAFKAFNNLDAAAQQMCVDTLPECVSMYADREEQFIPHPSSYINGKVFETLNDPQHNPTKPKESTQQTLTTYKAYDPNEKPEI